MPAFPLAFSFGRATLEVGVAAPARYLGPRNPPRTWTALVDTGANMSAISPEVIAAATPPELGYILVGRAGGYERPEPTYDIQIRLGGHRDGEGRWFRLEAIGVQPATPRVDVIIGTDLLAELDLHWRGPARAGWLSYD